MITIGTLFKNIDRTYKIVILLALLISFGSQLMASDSLSGLPVKLKYGVYIKRITPDFQNQTFSAEYYWWITFKNDPTVTGFTNDDIMNLEYVNGVNNTPGAILSEIFEKKTLSPNEYYCWGFHQGDFHFDPDFSNYPFDEQTLEMILESSVLEQNQLVFEADTSSFMLSQQQKSRWMLSDEMLKNKDLSYNIFKTEIIPIGETYLTNFGDPELPPNAQYGRIKIVTHLNRSIVPFFSKLIIPLLIILLLVYFVFFLPPEKIDIAAGLTVTSLLSSIAFQSYISAGLPEIGYIIFVDKLFFICYVLIVVCMGESLVTYFMDKTGIPQKMRRAKKIDYYSRIIFPFVFLGAILFIMN